MLRTLVRMSFHDLFEVLLIVQCVWVGGCCVWGCMCCEYGSGCMCTYVWVVWGVCVVSMGVGAGVCVGMCGGVCAVSMGMGACVYVGCVGVYVL